MQQIETPTAPRAATQHRTLRLAWLTLLGFFALFIALVVWAGLAVRNVYQTATMGQGATLFVRGPEEAISWRPAGRTVFQGSRDQQAIGEGEAVRIATSAGYGQAASIRLFEDSQLDLWAAAEVSFDTLRTSRWHSDTLEVELTQSGGYVRYDVKPNMPYASTSYLVRVGDATVSLSPGGSYSIEMRAPRAVERVDSGNTLIADVAVRSGSAVVTGANGGEVLLRARERVVVDPAGNPALAVPARWELVRDGSFSRFNELEYNNTTIPDPAAQRSNTWQVYGTPELPPEARGFFRLSRICRPPEVSDSNCATADWRTAAWFYRAGGQVTGFTTGIEQELGPEGGGVDIAEFRSLRLQLWVRVLYQSLNDAGDRGSECPVMIRLLAKRLTPADPEEQRVICIYSDADGVPPAVKEPGIEYRAVALAEWRQFTFDLREPQLLPDYRYLRSIQIYANGHDYDSRVAEVSIVGEQ
jgi:hypothetical protein